MKRWREQKAEKKKAADKKYYEKNREDKIATGRDSRDEKTQRPHTRKQSLKTNTKKRKQEKLAEEERREKIREQTRERVKRFREKQRAEFREQPEDNSTDTRGNACSAAPSSSAFKNRMAKAHALKRMTKSLPETPEKKAELVATISSSPRTKYILTKKGLIRTPEEAKETTALRALAADISEGVQHLKKSGSKDNRAAYTAFKTVAFGNSVSKSRAKKSLSKLVGVGRQSVIMAMKDRRKIMSGERKSWLYLEHKTRNDAVKDEDKQLIFNYWAYEASRPTGDKKDIIRKRTGKLQYITHVKHVFNFWISKPSIQM